MSHCVFTFQFNLFSDSYQEKHLNEFWCAIVLLERNQPPLSRAGPDKVIWLPVDTLTLDGNNSTDDQKILSYVWSLIGWVNGETFVLQDFTISTVEYSLWHASLWHEFWCNLVEEMYSEFRSALRNYLLISWPCYRVILDWHYNKFPLSSAKQYNMNA